MPIFLNFIRRFVIAAIVIPLAAAGVRKATEVYDQRRGPSRGTALLRKGADAAESLFGRQKRRRRFF